MIWYPLKCTGTLPLPLMEALKQGRFDQNTGKLKVRLAKQLKVNTKAYEKPW